MRKFRGIMAKLKKPKRLGGDIRTVFSNTYSIHNKLANRYKWYKDWHLKPYASNIHHLVLSLALISFITLASLIVIQIVRIPINQKDASAIVMSNISNSKEFTKEQEPTFNLDTGGLVETSEPKTNKGELTVGSAKIEAKITWNEQAIDTVPTISTKDQSGQFEIKVSNNQFKPGAYQLKVNINTVGKDQTLTQDFTWGVLAMNFNQSTYKVDEKATIGIAVLDNHGVTECRPDEKLKVTITAPDDQKTILTTADKSIAISPTCHDGNVTNEFDYTGSYTPEVEGKYQVKLEADTTNGHREMTESFDVKNNPDFVIRRLDTSMRIFPRSPYTVNVEVDAYSDLKGSIKEKVPASFAISGISGEGSIVENDETGQIISWPAEIIAGDKVVLSYTYDAPDISPEFYLLGPLEIWQNVTHGDGGQVSEAKIFTEPRAWQIATDATACSSSTTGGNWGTSTVWASPCSVSGGPTTNNDVTITNSAITITVEASTTRAANSITFTAGTSATTLQLSASGGAVLNVNGTGAGGYGIFITGTSAATKTVAVAQNTLSATSIRITSGSSTRIGQLTITTGIVNVTAGGITYSGTAGTAKVVFSGAGTINLTGDFLPGAFTQSTGKINANGSGAQSLGVFTYYNLDINNTGNSSIYVSFAGNPTISGALNINDGTLDFNNDVVGVTLGTTVGANGTALFSSATGLKTFTGDVTVSGIWSETAAVAVTYVGSLTNNASTWTASTGVHIFSGASKTISGTAETAIPNLTINAATGNSNVLTVSTALAGSNNLTNNSGATLNIGGTSAITTLTPAAAANTINYTGTAQTVHAAATNNYWHLGFSGTGANTIASPANIGTTITGNLTLTGTSNLTTAAALTVSGNLSVGTGTTLATGTTNTWTLTVTGTSDVTGTLTLANTGTKTFTGNVTLNSGAVWNETGIASFAFSGSLTNNATTFTASTGTHTFSGASKTISGSTSNVIPSVTINGATGNSGTLDVQTTLAGSNTLTNNAGGTLIVGASTANLTLTGLVASASTNLVKYDGAAGQTIEDTTDHHYSNLEIACPGQTATLAAALIVDNDLTITSGTLDTSGTSYSITVTGNWANSGTFTPNAGTVTFNKSSSTQTLNSGGTGAGKIFNSLTHSGAGTLQLITNPINIDGVFTNSAGTFDANDLNMNVADDFLVSGGTFSADVSPGATTQTVTFDGTNEATVSGSNTFRNLTMDTTTDGAKTIKFTIATIQTISGTWTLDGAVGNVLTLRSTSDTTAWGFAIPADINPSGDYIDVKDSQNNTNAYRITAGADYADSGNNVPGWLFPSTNTAPTNDSLTFTNPYSANAAIADNTTEWQFQAKVTDLDGSTDLSTVDIGFANSADSATPYNSLRYRWTRSTDTFSEVYDTQSAGTITSTSADSNAVGNQWTLDFKIKFNSSFATTATNYAAELYSIDAAAVSDTDNYANIYQVTPLSLSLNVDNASIDLGSLLPGSIVTGTTVTTVTTNYPNGYTLGVSDGATGSNSALLHTDTTTRIADYAGIIASPTTWTGTGLGICVFAATGKNTTKWGTGVSEVDPANKYAGVPETVTTIHSKTGSPTSGDQTSVGYKLVVPNTQKTGNYSGDITYTATGVLL